MSHEKQQQAGREEAREFLAALLLNLQALDQTNRALGQSMQQLVQQQHTLVSQLGMVSAQIDGLAQRCDLLENQIGQLSSILSDSPAPPPSPQGVALPPGHAPRGGGYGHYSLGGMVGNGIDYLLQQRPPSHRR